MTNKKKHPQFSIRASKKDWKEFQDISDDEMKIYPVLFRDMLDAYKEKKAKIMSRNRPVKASQSSQIRSDRVGKSGVGVREGGTK
ncbi:MAG TPA: hypothetical protein PKL77_07380 [Candidatus Omnitrophota bacterium]|nr:hypothetical protein [Candidatus Omnitrophota bacterium]